MDSILLAYDIFHGALNRKNRSMVARHATTLVLRFHSPTRCIRHNPDLAFVRQRNLNLILREVEDYSVSVSCVRILGSSCSLCISCRFRDEVVRKVLHLKA